MPLSWPRTRARSRYLKTPRYVPDGLSASDWAARQQKEKAAKVQNKAKYPKGAPQVPARRLAFFLMGSRGDGVAMASSPSRRCRRARPSRGTPPSPRWRRRGCKCGTLRQRHVVARRSSA